MSKSFKDFLCLGQAGKEHKGSGVRGVQDNVRGPQLIVIVKNDFNVDQALFDKRVLNRLRDRVGVLDGLVLVDGQDLERFPVAGRRGVASRSSNGKDQLDQFDRVPKTRQSFTSACRYLKLVTALDPRACTLSGQETMGIRQLGCWIRKELPDRLCHVGLALLLVPRLHVVFG